MLRRCDPWKPEFEPLSALHFKPLPSSLVRCRTLNLANISSGTKSACLLLKLFHLINMGDSERASSKRSRFDQTEPEPKRASRFDRRSRSPSAKQAESRRSRSPISKGANSNTPADGKKTAGSDAAAAAGEEARKLVCMKSTDALQLRRLPVSMLPFKPSAASSM